MFVLFRALAYDPARKFVVRGPYGFAQNPTYLGGGLALGVPPGGYESPAFLGFVALFFVATHQFVVLHEEPTLHRTFGEAYAAYRHRVHRWWPRPRSDG